MKKAWFPLTIAAICILLSSCDKEPIPEPTDLPKASEAKPLYIKAELGEELLNYEVNGEEINAESKYVRGGVMNPPHWGFGLFTTKEAFAPTLSFTLVNYSEENGEVKTSLDKTLRSENLEFMSFFDQGQNDFGKVSIEYFDGVNPPNSTFFIENDDLTITRLSDTLVNGESFKILEVKGQLKLRESPISPNIMELKNFEARMALRLE